MNFYINQISLSGWYGSHQKSKHRNQSQQSRVGLEAGFGLGLGFRKPLCWLLGRLRLPNIQEWLASASASASLNAIFDGFGLGFGFIMIFTAGFGFGLGFPEFCVWLPRSKRKPDHIKMRFRILIKPSFTNFATISIYLLARNLPRYFTTKR